MEVKAARSGNVSLKSSYVTVKGGELWLTNASFSVLHTEPGKSERTVDTGARKLLANKREIAEMTAAKDQGLTIVPLSMTTRTRFIKVKIATAKGKKEYDKRETIKRRDIERENKRVASSRY
jgi:SsrA-binding protein